MRRIQKKKNDNDSQIVYAVNKKINNASINEALHNSINFM